MIVIINVKINVLNKSEYGNQLKSFLEKLKKKKKNIITKLRECIKSKTSKY